MDYQRIYNEFIADRKLKEFALIESGEYKERHHVIPKSLGGNNTKENLLYLTVEDHIRGHLLLAKIHGGKMWGAVGIIFSRRNKEKIPDKDLFEKVCFARRNHGKFMSAFMKVNNPMNKSEHVLKITLKARTKENRERASTHSLNMWNTKGFKEKHRSVMETITSSKNFKDKVSAKSKAMWTDEYKLKYGNKIKDARAKADVCMRQSESLKQTLKSPEQRAKKSRVAKAVWDNDEYRERMSKARQGGNNPASKKVILLNTGNCYDTIRDAAKDNGVSPTTVRLSANGKIFKSGLVFKFA